MNTLQELVKEISALKPIPQVATQIMTLIEDPKSSMSDIADVIVYDPPITANLLRTCNSAFFALPRKVDSVRDAITLMGLDQVVEIVLLKSLNQNLIKGQSGYDLDEGDLWRQAVSCAIIARELAEKQGIQAKYMLFTAALLKDIGKVVLNRFVGDSFQKINRLVQNEGLSFKEAEKRVIGIDHAELGGLVAKTWKFSPKMTYIIENHHLTDENARTDLETAVVYMADTVCMMMGIGVGSDGLAYRFHKDVLDLLKISESELQVIIADFSIKVQEVDDLLKVV
jgi:putative nucleotidyltransferase with HDIG domain